MVFCAALVVQDQMQIEIVRHVRVDGAQELQELLGPMAPMQLTDDGAGCTLNAANSVVVP